MQNIDIDKIVKQFREKLLNKEFKCDTLRNSFPPYIGDIVKADDEAFDRFRTSETYKRILSL